MSETKLCKDLIRNLLCSEMFDFCHFLLEFLILAAKVGIPSDMNGV